MDKNCIYKILDAIAGVSMRLKGKLFLRDGKKDFFIRHVVDPKFDIKPYLKKKNPYFGKYGFDFSMLESAYYRTVSGVDADYYIPQAFFSYYLLAYLNKEGVSDKNMFRKLLPVFSTDSGVDFRMPYQIAANWFGTYYDCKGNPTTLEDSVKDILAYGKDMILKPTYNTTWGRGVIKVSAGVSEQEIRNLISEYKENFSLEECVVQHADLATFNKTSLNTTRIVTYRRPNGEIKVLFALQRFGKEGAVVDNASAGGNIVALHEDGRVFRTIVEYKSLKKKKLDDKVIDRIPFFDKTCDVVKKLHAYLPLCDIVGWDMSVTQDGTPVMIEFNTRPSVTGIQLAKGPAFSKEDLDEILPEIAKRGISSKCSPYVYFPSRPGNTNSRMKK